MKQILHGVNSSNTFKSDHSRLGLVENKFLEKIQIRPNFLRLTASLLYKILPKNMVACKPEPFILFIYQIWGESVLWGAVFIIQISDRTRYTILQDKYYTLIQYSGRSKHGLLAIQCVKKIQTVLLFHRRQICIASCCVRMNIITLMLQHDIVYFLSNSFITMCNLKKRLIRVTFWVLLQAMFMNVWKQTAQRLKLQDLSKRD